MEADSATVVRKISPGRPSRWHGFRARTAQWQVSIEAESLTGVTQISPGSPRRCHGVSTLTAQLQ
eukprot:7069516-Karenia_brevis.AAC.1